MKHNEQDVSEWPTLQFELLTKTETEYLSVFEICKK